MHDYVTQYADNMVAPTHTHVREKCLPIDMKTNRLTIWAATVFYA